MSVLGNALAYITSASSPGPLSEASISFTNNGDNIIIPGIAGQGIYVFKYFVVVGTATNLTYKDGVNLLTGPIVLAANEAMVFTFDTRPWYSTTLGNDFIINSSSAVQVSGRVYYLQI